MSTINRKCHCLKRKKSLVMPRHIIFFDTETEQYEMPDGSVKQELKLGWALYYRQEYGRHLEKVDWRYFETQTEFWSFVYEHTACKQKLWLIARNIAFDFTVLNGWKYLSQVGFRLKFFHNSGSTVVISVTGRYGSLIFLDSANWFAESLASTGLRIGLPKLDIDFETCSLLELGTYCHRDVEIEFENFKRFMGFLRTERISRLCYTRASTAMSAYLFGFYDTKIWIHNNAEAIDLERESYKGGRTECFYLGSLNSENYYILDVNSLYPAVMREHVYPVKYVKITGAITRRSLQANLRNKAAVARVLIDTDEPAYAVKRDRTLFPVGKFWTVLTTPELKYALEHKHIKEVKEAVFYEHADIFRKYVERFYIMRQKFKASGQSESDEFCKKLLNSLYGKFGQKAEVWEKIGECPGERDRTEICYYAGQNNPGAVRYLLGEIFELVGFEECFNSFPAIAAHVSAYGRMCLYELMKQAGAGNYFYCDTDSLVVNEAGLCNLKSRISNTVLGSLKVVQTTQKMVIRGLKDYSIDAKQVVKGIRKNAVQISDGVYEQELWPTFRGLLRNDIADSYTVKKQRKILSRKYTKGTVADDGIVSPFVLDDACPSQQQLW